VRFSVAPGDIRPVAVCIGRQRASRKCFIRVLADIRSLFPDLNRIQQIVHTPMTRQTGASCPLSADESDVLFSGLFNDETLFKTRCAHRQRPARVRYIRL
jgi:hypothetical protein